MTPGTKPSISPWGQGQGLKSLLYSMLNVSSLCALSEIKYATERGHTRTMFYNDSGGFHIREKAENFNCAKIPRSAYLFWVCREAVVGSNKNLVHNLSRHSCCSRATTCCEKIERYLYYCMAAFVREQSCEYTKHKLNFFGSNDSEHCIWLLVDDRERWFTYRNSRRRQRGKQHRFCKHHAKITSTEWRHNVQAYASQTRQFVSAQSVFPTRHLFH